jgi:hypothetical protein
MYLNVPQFKTTFIVPFKSGNKLIYSTLLEVFNLNKIEYSINSNSYDFEKNCILFVRNPINRFFSGYQWCQKIIAGPEDILIKKEDEKKIIDNINLSNINSLSSYISNYKNFINLSEDYHSLPQTSFFLKRSQDVDIRSNIDYNFRKEYDDAFVNNYRFFRIEEIDDIIKTNNEILISNEFNKFEINGSILKNENIKYFKFFNTFPPDLNYQFMAFYSFFKNYFDYSNHHSNNNQYYYDEITKDDYLKVFEMFKKELLFFGYDDEIGVEINKFKNN